MKKVGFGILVFLLVSIGSFSQDISLGTKSTTRAVVVGISDYQDPEIPDLKFADRDAIAFANFLRSEAGGGLSDDQLILLTNEEATQAQFAVSLDWLWEETQEGDKAVIYFSGHGDVEKKSFSKPGYLLCWNAPSRVYMAGGAFSLSIFKDIISSLSLQNKAKVLVITDACRAGKLSGNSVNGSQLTSNNLQQRFANEIKILSCQPDELSIEGEQWGGGRGVFSYHLLDGLYGMADRNNDLEINLMEIQHYIQEKVTSEVAPHNQLPMVIGDIRENLFRVNENLLADFKLGKKGQMKNFASVDTRGIEDDILESMSRIAKGHYRSFKMAITEKRFFSPAENCAEYSFRHLMNEKKLDLLHPTITRNYAAALQDDAQTVLNRILKSEVKEMSLSRIDKSKKYKTYPAYLQRAADLLGEDHFLYPSLMSRKLYFEAYLLSASSLNPDVELGNKALNKLREALTYQEGMPQVYLSMSSVFGYNLMNADSAEHYAKLAMEESPSWILPYTTLATILITRFNQPDKTKIYLEAANKIDSNSVVLLNYWGNYYLSKNELEKAEYYYNKSIQADSTFLFPQGNLALVYNKQGRIEEAEKLAQKVCLLDSTDVVAYEQYGNILWKRKKYEEAIKIFNKAIKLDGEYVNLYDNLGSIYFFQRRYEEAENYIKKAIELDPSSRRYNMLGGLSYTIKKFEEAEIYFKKALELDPEQELSYQMLGKIFKHQKRYSESEINFKKTIDLNPGNSINYYSLACLMSFQEEVDRGFEYLENAFINGYSKWDSLFDDPDLNFLRSQAEKWKAMMLKYFPERFKD